VALSTDEAEVYAIVIGSSIGLGMKPLLGDLGHRAKAKLSADATTGNSLASRRGLGQISHIEVSEIWIQGAVKKERIDLAKSKRPFDLAGLFTKHVDRSTLDKLAEGLGGLHSSRRHELAAQLNMVHGDVRRKGAKCKMADGKAKGSGKQQTSNDTTT